MDRVGIRNIIGGAAGAHISMTSYAGATVLARRLSEIVARSAARRRRRQVSSGPTAAPA